MSTRYESLSELKNKAFCPPAMKNDSIEKILHRLGELKRSIELSMRKDLETQYIYLGRYIGAVTAAQKCNSQFTKAKYPRIFEETKKYLERCFKLDEEVRKLYEKKNMPDTRKKSYRAPDINRNGHTEISLSELEKDIENGNAVLPDPPVADVIKDFIDPKEIYQMIKNKSENYLILDIRQSEDYKLSHLKDNDRVLAIGGEKLKKGISAMKIGEVLDNMSQTIWAKRTSYDKLIIMDFKSQEKSKSDELNIMIDAIYKWDINQTYKCEIPFYVNGGYFELITQYPILASRPLDINPFSRLPKLDNMPDVKFDLTDIDVRETPPQEPLVPKVPLSFDRSLKPALSNTSVSEVSIPNIENSLTLEEILENDPVPSKDPSVETNTDSVSNRSSHQPNVNLDEMRKLKPNLSNTNSSHFEETETEVSSRSFSQANFGSTNSDDEIHFEPLKDKESPNLKLGGLHKTYSSPDIRKLNDNDRPHFSRANKPSEISESFRNKDDLNYGQSSLGNGLTGLKNFANNCYMNSIMQCLSNTKPLLDALIRSKDYFNQDYNKNSQTKGKILQHIKDAFLSMWGHNRCYSIADLKEEMGNIKDIFKGSAHQDSNEFLIILLEHLHEELKMPSQIHSLEGAREETGEKAWGEFLLKNTSVIQEIFYGQHKSTVRCESCDYKSITFEQFFNLFVPLPPISGTVSLMDCIKLYMAGERISGWKCPRCKAERNATKQFEFSKLPRILVIALKRFTQDDYSWLHKKENLVTYPLRSLDMSRFLVPSSEHRFHKYDLYAMSVHTGTLKSGHYRAICKNSDSNCWYMFDDMMVERLSEQDVENNNEVYILFYKAVRDE